MLSRPSTLIILIEAKLKVLEPLDLLVTIVLGTLGADYILDQNAAVLVKLIPPVAVGSRRESDQVRGGLARRVAPAVIQRGFDFSRGHDGG